MHAMSGIFGPGESLKVFFCAWTPGSKYQCSASKILMGHSCWVLVWFIHMWVLRMFPHSLLFYTALRVLCIVLLIRAIYEVRSTSSHIVSIRTGPKSTILRWDWSAVIDTNSASSSSLYVQNGKRHRTCSRRSVHYYCQTSYNTCRGTNIWPLIGSKLA